MYEVYHVRKRKKHILEAVFCTKDNGLFLKKRKKCLGLPSFWLKTPSIHYVEVVLLFATRLPAIITVFISPPPPPPAPSRCSSAPTCSRWPTSPPSPQRHREETWVLRSMAWHSVARWYRLIPNWVFGVFFFVNNNAIKLDLVSFVG